MLLKDLTEVWISKYEKVSDHGEIKKIWKYKDMAYLNLQQDLNELDRNSAGEVDYGIENARTDMEYDIQKGNGISLKDISKLDSFIPDYTVTDCPKIGNTTLYKLEKYNGD
ncbi:MAG TPA: hypothetical protein IAB70_02110 [Candidatus Merdicola faecigallinarum]|uniref:Uncharacterized protein n=1 Tax=Candidatus Merdicola faecigallinarum TaxID=2840862 RepID=A0A9D1S934_9FIRM|nr:hypothetical protein [Candidatus Merdicola faecigallinarum]